MTHGALHLDHLRAAGAAMALDGFGDAALSLDLVAEVGELLGGVLDVGQVLVASAALDLLGDGDALEAGVRSVNLHKCLR